MLTPQHMTLNPNRGAGRFVWGPLQPNKSNEAIVLAPILAATYPDGLPAGTLLAKITAAGATLGQYAPYDPAAADGTQLLTALGLLWADTLPSAAAQPGTIVARDAVVNANLLNYAVALTAPQLAAAIAGLATQQVIARN
jgi:hypothetical protein